MFLLCVPLVTMGPTSVSSSSPRSCCCYTVFSHHVNALHQQVAAADPEVLQPAPCIHSLFCKVGMSSVLEVPLGLLS